MKYDLLVKNTQPFVAAFLGAFLNAPPYRFKTIRNGFPIKFYVPMTFFWPQSQIVFSRERKKIIFLVFYYSFLDGNTSANSHLNVPIFFLEAPNIMKNLFLQKKWAYGPFLVM